MNTVQILAENHMVVPKNGVQEVPILSHSLILWEELHMFSVGAKTFCKALSHEQKAKFTLFGENTNVAIFTVNTSIALYCF